MTRRQDITKILSERKQTAQQLANYFETDLSEILVDLEHISKSTKPRKLKSEPAFCKKCGFKFEERSRVKKPSRCPRCKSEWIEAQLFYIE